MNYKRGDQIIYIPSHAEGDKDHPDCEFGFVVQHLKPPQVTQERVACRFWSDRSARHLRTRSCSENAYVEDIRPFAYTSQSVIDEAMELYVEGEV